MVIDSIRQLIIKLVTTIIVIIGMIHTDFEEDANLNKFAPFYLLF